MIQKAFAILILICCAASGMAQAPDYQRYSKLFLRGGVSIIGEIVEESAGELRIRQAMGNEMTIPKYNIKYYLPAEDLLLYDNMKYHIARGRFFNISLGMNTENIVTDNDEVSSHLTFMYGYNFPSGYSVAAGVAVEFNQASISGFNFDTQFLPVFVYGRYYLDKSKKRPFLYGRIGYGFKAEEETFSNDHNGGIQLQGGAGILFASRKKSKFIMSLGYHLQKTDGMESFLDPFGNEITTSYDIWIRRLILKFGIEINKGKRKFK